MRVQCGFSSSRDLARLHVRPPKQVVKSPMGVNTTLPKLSGAVCFNQRFDRVFALMSAGLADGGQIRLVGLISPVGH